MCVFCEDEIKPVCSDCDGCNECCECESDLVYGEVDPDWDEDFGGYPDEEPARWERHCRSMLRAMEAGVD